jgi:Cyclic nucleotide-binding domain/Major Facilitator Superfamily
LLSSVVVSDGKIKAAFSPGFSNTAFAYLVGIIIDDATFIATLTYAFHRHGADAVGISQLILLAVASLSLPLQASILCRFRPLSGTRFHFTVLASCCFLGVLALAFEAPAPIVWLALGIILCLCNSYRQVIFSILPTIAPGGRALAAQNIVLSWNESAAKIVAPILCALVLSNISDVTHGVAGVFFGAALAAVTVVVVIAKAERSDGGFRPTRRSLVPSSPANSVEGRPTSSVDSVASILRRNRPLRALLLLTFGRFATVGAASVLYLSLAQSSGLGVTRSGALFWAFGFGGLLSVLARKMVIGRAHLTSRLVFFGCLSSAAWMAIAFTTESPVAIFVFVVISGFGGSMYSVIRLTLAQRLAPPDAMLRTSTVFQMSVTLGIASGALVMLVAGTVQRACIVASLALPLFCVLTIRGLREIDGAADVPVTEIGLLRRNAVLRSLSPVAIESLARRCEVRTYQDSALVIREGDVGAEVFVIVDGTCDVLQDGQQIRRLVRGEIFGEIAVLSDRPRSASIFAIGIFVVLVISKEDFVNVVSLHEEVRVEVQTLTNERP